MSLSETRFGANAPGLPRPTPLPPLSAALSRRAALFGAVTVAGVTLSACSPAKGHAAAQSPNDARLVALADEYEAVDRAVAAISSEAPGYDVLISRYTDIEVEAAEIPADTLIGVAAKARLCQSPAARGCADYAHILSAVDDAFRLLSTGSLS